MPQFSIIVPVDREAENINSLLQSLLTIYPEPPELIVVDGDPERSTLNAIDERFYRKYFSALKLATAPRGRARQMNYGASLATGQWLIFLHADSRLPPGALELIARREKEDNHRAGGFELKIDSSHPFLRLVSFLTTLRSRLTHVPYGDQAIHLKRSLFNELNGYSDFPLLEDVDLMRRLKRRGENISILPLPVTTSPRRWEKRGLFFCTLRNRVIVLLNMIGVSPERLSNMYD